MNTKVENELVNQSGERLISKQELARRLKKSVRTISKWQRCGIIPFVKCRRAVFYDWQSVLHHLQQREILAQTAAQSEIRSAIGPIRLPVYQMREEPTSQAKRPRATSAAQPGKDYEH